MLRARAMGRDAMNLKRITAAEAKQLVKNEGYKIIDVRSMPEYDAEHPEGAYNIPYLHRAPHGMIPNSDFVRVVQAVFPDKDTKLITSCQMGGRSVRAAAELSNLGYTNVVDLRGGFGGERDDTGAVVVPGWKDQGLPTEAGGESDLAYKALQQRVAPSAPPPAERPEPAHEHGHAHGHEHGHGHGHSHGPAAPAPKPPGTFNRFADPKHIVQCVKFKQPLPGLKRRPFPGPLGERIRSEVSADAWELWAEHAKMIMNEYRLNPSDPKAQEILMKQCEAFFYGEGAQVPEAYVPESQTK